MKTTEAKVEIDILLCKGCGLCVLACPQSHLGIGSQSTAQGYFPAVVKEGGACNACAACGTICPDAAITVTLTRGAPQASEGVPPAPEASP
ncbi:MAG: 4Fe-4S dicluster domain-containing protein [Planctomycetota bacterium]